eukprot:1293282-Amphidinium_carterae.2
MGSTQKVNIDEIYAATPGAITLHEDTTDNRTTQQPQHIHVRHTVSIPQYTSTARHNNTCQTTSGMRTRQQHTVKTQQTIVQRLEGQLQLKHVTRLERGQPLVFLGRQIEYYNDQIALSMTKEYYNSQLSLYNIKENTNNLSTTGTK